MKRLGNRKTSSDGVIRKEIETVCSIFNRHFGEIVSVKRDYIVKKIAAKVWIYNSLKTVLC